MRSNTTQTPFDDAVGLQFIQQVEGGMHPSSSVLYGRHARDWRSIAQNALAALRQNPNDVGARRTLESAQQVLRLHVQNLAREAHAANAQSRAEAQTPDISRGQAAAISAMDPYGIANEMGGFVAALPRLARLDLTGASEAQSAAEQRVASVTAAAREQQPLGSFLGAMGGGAVMAPLEVLALSRSAPGLFRAIAAGNKVGAAPGVRTTAAVAGGLLASGNAAARGFGEADNAGIGGRLEAAVGSAWPAFLLGAASIETPTPRIPLLSRGENIGVNPAIRRQRLATMAEQRLAAQTTSAENAAIASQYDPAVKQAALHFHEARGAEADLQRTIAEQTMPYRIQSAKNAAASSDIRLAETASTARQRAIQQEARTAAAQSQQALIPLREEMARAQAELVRARVENIPRQVQLAEARVQKIAGDLALHESRVAAIPDQATILSERALRAPDETAITAMRRAMMEGKTGAGATSAADAADATTRAYLEQQGYSQDLIERTLANMRAQRAPTVTALSEAPVEIPMGPHPATMPTPSEAARAAYNLTEAAQGPDAALAARRAAGHATNVATPAVDALDFTMRIAQSPPTVEAVDALTAHLGTMNLANQRRTLMQIALVNPAWRPHLQTILDAMPK